jgi:hypothetical protein
MDIKSWVMFEVHQIRSSSVLAEDKPPSTYSAFDLRGAIGPAQSGRGPLVSHESAARWRPAITKAQHTALSNKSQTLCNRFAWLSLRTHSRDLTKRGHVTWGRNRGRRMRTGSVVVDRGPDNDRHFKKEEWRLGQFSSLWQFEVYEVALKWVVIYTWVSTASWPFKVIRGQTDPSQVGHPSACWTVVLSDCV